MNNEEGRHFLVVPKAHNAETVLIDKAAMTLPSAIRKAALL